MYEIDPSLRCRTSVGVVYRSDIMRNIQCRGLMLRGVSNVPLTASCIRLHACFTQRTS